MNPFRPTLALVALALCMAVADATRASAQSPADSTAEVVRRDTLTFRPVGDDAAPLAPAKRASTDDAWLIAPLGDDLLDHPEPWDAARPNRSRDLDLTLDYNRVDLLRWGAHVQVQRPSTMYPRLGVRLEYAHGRERALYGVQMEQPLLPTARFVLGVSAVRRTEHPDLQQVGDLENTLSVLLARNDQRDYFEREGAGVHLSWRVPDFSTVSVHARRDEYHTLAEASHTTSWLYRDRTLRANPAVDDGEAHRVLVRLERLAHRRHSTRAGLYHAIEFDHAGGELGGDFDYRRWLADVRSVLRLSPAVTLTLRAVGGSTLSGTLPRQRRFTLGGADGLRGHATAAFTGSHVALGQAEYAFGLWAVRGKDSSSGLTAIAFVDAGTAWEDPSGRWEVMARRFTTDAGFGLAVGEDDLRVYAARDLQAAGAPIVWSLRLQRPF